MLHNNENMGTENRACDSRVSRKEFLTTLVRRATVAGALLAAPKVIDKFLIPPAFAVTSTSGFSDSSSTQHDTNGHVDTNPANDSHGLIHSSPNQNDFG